MPIAETSIFKSLHVLLVEDEVLVAMHTEGLLVDIGCEAVEVASSVPQALALIERTPPDVALLDVNVRNVMVFPVAEKLAAAGIPFAFATGYGRSHLLLDWQHYPILQKPLEMAGLERALKHALSKAAARPG